MHKQITEAHQWKIQIIEETWVKIMNLEKGLCIEITVLKEDFCAQIHLLWDELQSARDENRWLWGEL